MRQPSRASRFIQDWLRAGTPAEPHTQEILARRVSEQVGRVVSQSTISHIKSGSQSPRADLVAAFRVILGIEAEWWLPELGAAPVLPATGTDN